MREIEVSKPLVTFLWFLVGTCVLAAIGAKVPSLTQHVGDIMQEQIAGKTIIVFSVVTLFLAFLCAIRNIVKPAPYGSCIGHLIVDPTNFIVTLTFVAAAVNWGVTLSSYCLFPLIVRGAIFEAAVRNAVQISIIAVIFGSFVWALHYRPATSKTTQPLGTASKAAFWVAFVSSTVFFVFFFGRLGFLVLNA